MDFKKEQKEIADLYSELKVSVDVSQHPDDQSTGASCKKFEVTFSEPVNGQWLHNLISDSLEREERNRPQPSNGKTILIDDTYGDMVVEITTERLEKFGYEVVSFPTSEEALEYYKEHFQEINVVLTNHLKTTMTAEDFIAEIKKTNSLAKVVCVTGHRKETIGYLDADYLSKPYTVEQLLKVIS